MFVERCVSLGFGSLFLSLMYGATSVKEPDLFIDVVTHQSVFMCYGRSIAALFHKRSARVKRASAPGPATASKDIRVEPSRACLWSGACLWDSGLFSSHLCMAQRR